MANILVLYYSRTGNTQAMAEVIATGVEGIVGCTATIRTVPAVGVKHDASLSAIPNQGPPYATLTDLEQCNGLILGSPTRFGNMAGALKYFFDTTGGLWQSGALIGKPAGCFTSTGSMHGGQESTLLSMMLPLMHHGMVLVGCPYSEPALINTTHGGTPYGPSHVSGANAALPLTDDESTLCRHFGARIATIAQRLK